MTAKRKTRVHWTDKEMEQVVGEAVKIAFENREYVWAHVAEGQKVLPEERRRFITGKAGINAKIMEAFCQERQEILETGVPFPVNIEEPPVEILVERPREEILKSITTEELIALIAKRLAPVLEAIPSLLQKSEGRLAPSSATPAVERAKAIQPIHSTPVERKRKVLLFGFLPRQEPVIREGATNLNLELVFAKKDSQMKGTTPSCQWVVAMKSSHSATDKLKERSGKFFYVNGTKAAIDALRDIHSFPPGVK